MVRKEIQKKWDKFFKNHLDRGLSKHKIKEELVYRGYKLNHIDSLFDNYEKKQEKKKKVLVSVMVVLLAFLIMMPFIIKRPTITGAPVGVGGDIFYVDATNGNDSNDGSSPGNAIKSLAKVSTLSLDPGDSVLFDNCDIWREAFRFYSQSGTASNPILFASYGSCSGKPRFYGSINASSASYWTDLGSNLWETPANYTQDITSHTRQMFHNTGSNPTPGQIETSLTGLNAQWDFYWNSTSNKITVYSTGNPASLTNGIEIPEYNTTYYSLIHFQNADYIIFKDIEIAYARLYGLEIDTNSEYAELRNLDFKYVYGKGVWLEGDNVLLDNCTFDLAGIRGQASPIGQSAQGEVIWITQNSRATITHNTIMRCGGVCINPFHTTLTNISYNRVYDSRQDITDWSGGIYFDGCNNSVASYNNISDGQIGIQVGNEISGWSSRNITFHHNVVFNNSISDMVVNVNDNIAQIGNYDININHNSFYKDNYVLGSGFGNQIFAKYFSNLTFEDNIIYNTYSMSGVGTLLYIYVGGAYGNGLASNYNMWNSSIGRDRWDVNSSRTYSSLSAWVAGQSQDIDSVSLAPFFVNDNNKDFRPQSDSPACSMSSTGSYVGALPCEGGSSPSCGDDSCNGAENCSSCAADCGACAPSNTAPSHSTPILNASDNPINSTNATLRCYNRSTADADGDSVTNSYRWFRNTSLVAGLSSNTVNAGNTSVGNSWICEVKPYDGEAYGTARNSSALVIRASCSNGVCEAGENCSSCAADCGACISCGDYTCNGAENCSSCAADCGACAPSNTVPTHSTPVLNASDYPANGTSATLRCYNRSTADVNGDSVTNLYRWFRNGTLVLGLSSSTVSAGNTSVGNSWICEVKPYDGIGYGVVRNSSALVIRSVCSNDACEAGENCSSCAVDCGACPVDETITACTLENKSWNEDTTLSNAFDLSGCFHDNLNYSLVYFATGNSSINVIIGTNGSVNLSAPLNWFGVEHVIFTASAGIRSNQSNNITLMVLPVADCNNDICEAGETCTNCEADCGECASSSGGGGGGGGSAPVVDVNESVVNESAINESAINESAVNETSINETTFNESNVTISATNTSANTTIEPAVNASVETPGEIIKGGSSSGKPIKNTKPSTQNQSSKRPKSLAGSGSEEAELISSSGELVGSEGESASIDNSRNFLKSYIIVVVIVALISVVIVKNKDRLPLVKKKASNLLKKIVLKVKRSVKSKSSLSQQEESKVEQKPDSSSAVEKRLESYIKGCLEYGYDYGAIRVSLQSKNVSSESINKVFKELQEKNFAPKIRFAKPVTKKLHLEAKDKLISALSDALKKQKAAGFTNKDIRQMLLNYGYPKDVVEEVMKGK